MTQATCTTCQQKFDFRQVGYTVRQIDADLKEIGIECPNCQEWYHSYFTNPALEAGRPHQGADRKERRAYQKAVKRFNKKMRAALGMVKKGGRWVRREVANA